MGVVECRLCVLGVGFCLAVFGLMILQLLLCEFIITLDINWVVFGMFEGVWVCCLLCFWYDYVCLTGVVA